MASVLEFFFVPAKTSRNGNSHYLGRARSMNSTREAPRAEDRERRGRGRTGPCRRAWMRPALFLVVLLGQRRETDGKTINAYIKTSQRQFSDIYLGQVCAGPRARLRTPRPTHILECVLYNVFSIVRARGPGSQGGVAGEKVRVHTNKYTLIHRERHISLARSRFRSTYLASVCRHLTFDKDGYVCVCVVCIYVYIVHL